METTTRPTSTEPDVHWRQRAECRDADPELFAPLDDMLANFIPKQAVRASALFCDECPVVERCRAYAAEQDTVGLWGGQWRHFDRDGHAVATDMPSRRVSRRVQPAPRPLAPLSEVQQAVLDAIGVGPTATGVLIEVTGFTRGRLNKALEALGRRELVTSPRWGVWCRTADESAEAA